VRHRARQIVVVISIVGAIACLLAVGRFVFRVLWNGLSWSPELGVRDYYLAVGESYGQGFAAGFFFCFFLSFAAVAFMSRGRVSRSAAAVAREPRAARPVPESAEQA
jgi:hypothetical protein